MADIHDHSQKPLSNDADPLLILRGVACLMVVISHCNPPRNSIVFQNYDLSWLIFAPGGVSVCIFFCLSGYLIGKGFYSERYPINLSGIIIFIKNRSVRLLPLYSFAVLILSIFVYPEIFKFENLHYLFRLFTFTYQPYINLETSYPFFNPAFWSLSTEVQFYLMAPFIYSLLSFYIHSLKQAFLLIISLILLVAFLKYYIILFYAGKVSSSIGYSFTYLFAPLHNNIDIFLSGFMVNIYIKQTHLKNKSSIFQSSAKKQYIFLKYLSIVLICLLYLYCQYHLYHQELISLPNRTGGLRTATSIFLLQPVTAIITAFFIYAFEIDNYYCYTKNKKLSLNVILNKPLRFLEVFGILSYGIYLWHSPILDKVTPIFTSNIPIVAFLMRLTGAVIISIVLSICTYYLVELPAVKWKSNPDKPNI